MARQTIGTGTAANDGTGDPLRTAFTKANDNFAEIYAERPAFIRLGSDYVLTSTTAAQKLFDTATGALTLPTGIYTFELLAMITGLSATSGNGAFSLAGTAVLADQLFHAVGRDDSTPTTANAQTGSFVQGSSAHSGDTVSATTGTAMSWRETGSFEVTTAGTVIPSIALTTAAAGVVKAGSLFLARRIAPLGTNSRDYGA